MFKRIPAQISSLDERFFSEADSLSTMEQNALFTDPRNMNNVFYPSKEHSFVTINCVDLGWVSQELEDQVDQEIAIEQEQEHQAQDFITMEDYGDDLLAKLSHNSSLTYSYEQAAFNDSRAIDQLKTLLGEQQAQEDFCNEYNRNKLGLPF